MGEPFSGIIMVVLIALPLVSFLLACICAAEDLDEDDEDEHGEELRLPVVLPNFPYAQARVPVEPVMCAICLDELQHGQLCSEVPACRHVFHEACMRAWGKKTNSCPLCRVRIGPGTRARGRVAAANDMV